MPETNSWPEACPHSPTVPCQRLLSGPIWAALQQQKQHQGGFISYSCVCVCEHKKHGGEVGSVSLMG